MVSNRPAEGNVGRCVGQRRFREQFRESRAEHQGIGERVDAIEGPTGPEAVALRFGQSRRSDARLAARSSPVSLTIFLLRAILYTIYTWHEHTHSITRSRTGRPRRN
jgi:hypothetical protein